MNSYRTLPVSKALAGVSARVKVIGVGDAGCRAAAGMADSLRGLADVTCVDTDSVSLQRVNNARRLLIGQAELHGFGAGGDADAAREAAEQAREEVQALVAGAESVIILAGLGGGTGSGAAPVIAAEAKAAGAHTFCIANTPFEFEGAGREAVAAAAMLKLRQACDGVAEMSNDRLAAWSRRDTTLDEALAQGHALTATVVRTVAGLFAQGSGPEQIAPGNLRSALSGGMLVLLGEGEASGQAAAAKAAEAALDRSCSKSASIERAAQAVVLIEAGPELSLSQVAAAMGTVRARTGDAAVLHMGTSRTRKLAGRVRVLVMAACSEDRKRVAVAQPTAGHSTGQGGQRILMPLLA